MVNLDTASSADLAHLLGRDRPTILVGSGISLWQPTNLPTGQDFTKGVIQAVFAPATGAPTFDPADQNLLDELLDSLPFEMLLERCPDQHKIGSLLAMLYGATAPNPVHEALAAMAGNGAVESIITTNYDLALDSALDKIGTPLAKVVRESHIPQTASRLYFKVHGSADDPGSLVYSIRLESRLPAWKRQVLSRCVNNRPLLFIGYSGLDFELCPEISRLNPSVIDWNFFAAADMEKPGVKYLSKHGTPPKPLLGNMTRLLELLGYPVPTIARSTVALNIADMIRRHFGVEELLLWRARLFNTMGYCRLAIDTLKPLRAAGYSGADLEYAQALFQSGAYLRAGEQFIDVSRQSTDEREQALRLLDASDAFRCYGRLVISYVLVLRAERLAGAKNANDTFVRSRIAMKKLLLLQDLVRRLPWGSFIIRELGTRLVISGAPAALESGDWLAFQQFMLMAERWAINKSTFGQAGIYDPPAPKDGYRHLGFRVGELLNLLEHTRQSPSSVTYRELAGAFRTSVRLGSHPIAWKVAAFMAARFPWQHNRYRHLYRHHLGLCEYSRIRRWIKTRETDV